MAKAKSALSLPVYFVYALLDTRHPGVFEYGRWKFKFKPFYVGKGSSDRPNHHFRIALKRSDASKSSAKDIKIRNILKETGSLPRVRTIKDNLLEEAAFKLERKIVQTIGRIQLKTGPLTNRSDGGEGQKNVLYSEEMRAATSENNRKMWENFSAKEKKARISNMTAGHARMPEEMKAKRRKNTSEGLQSMSPKAKKLRAKRISEALVEVYEADPKIKKRAAKSNSITRQNYSDAEREHMSTAVAAGHANRSEKALKKSSKIKSEAGKLRVANMTDREKKAHAKRMKVAVTAMHASLSKEERSERIRKGHLSKDHESINAKIAASTVLAHAAMSAKDKAAKAEKIRQTLLNRPPEVLQRLAAGNFMRGALRRAGHAVDHPRHRPKLDRLIADTPWNGQERMLARFKSLVNTLLGI